MRRRACAPRSPPRRIAEARRGASPAARAPAAFAQRGACARRKPRFALPALEPQPAGSDLAAVSADQRSRDPPQRRSGSAHGDDPRPADARRTSTIAADQRASRRVGVMIGPRRAENSRAGSALLRLRSTVSRRRAGPVTPPRDRRQVRAADAPGGTSSRTSPRPGRGPSARRRSPADRRQRAASQPAASSIHRRTTAASPVVKPASRSWRRSTAVAEWLPEPCRSGAGQAA